MSRCTPAPNGSTVVALRQGSPVSARRPISSAPAGSSASSSHIETSMSSRFPTYTGGTNGRAGMSCLSAACQPTVRGRVGTTRAYSRSAAAACSGSQTETPMRIIGPNSWAPKVNRVTMPKLPPPPRSAQKSSGCEPALTSITSPLARTSSSETKLSQVRPCLRENQPMPPPSARPPTPVSDMIPAATISLCGAVAASTSPRRQPPPTCTSLRSGSTVTSRRPDRSMVRPPSDMTWVFPSWLRADRAAVLGEAAHGVQGGGHGLEVVAGHRVGVLLLLGRSAFDAVDDQGEAEAEPEVVLGALDLVGDRAEHRARDAGERHPVRLLQRDPLGEARAPALLI